MVNDDPRARTADAFANPEVGDRFHEMWSYWVYVIGIDGDQVTTFESGYHPSQHPTQGERKIYPTREAFRRHFAYGTIPGYWVTLQRRGCDVASWLDGDWVAVPVPTIRIEPVTTMVDTGGQRVTTWRWVCTCHGESSTVPWQERPTEANARVEHDLVVGARPLLPRCEWVR